MADASKQLSKQKRPIPSPAGETILAALLVGAVVNLLLVLEGVLAGRGGYEIILWGRELSSHTLEKPLIVVAVLAAVRWLMSLPRTGIKASLKGLFPWGVVFGVAGAALLFISMGPNMKAAPLHIPAVAAAISLGAFLLAWLSYGGVYARVSRHVIVIVYLAFSAAIGASFSHTEAWDMMERFLRTQYAGATLGALQAGLLSEKGSGVVLEKVGLDNDWRDCAKVEAGGFFLAQAEGSAGTGLRFSAGRQGDISKAVARVTLVRGEQRTVLWQEPASSLPDKLWQDVALAVPGEGDAEIVFEVEASGEQGAILFANPRLVPAAGKAPGDTTNVILIVVDALRADRLGAYGYDRPTSPEIDALVDGGSRLFENCLAPSSWTVPATASMLTGLYPGAHGMTSTERGLAPTVETLAECLRRAGYYTGALQTNPLLTVDTGIAQGFARYRWFPERDGGLGAESKYATCTEVNHEARKFLEGGLGEPFFLYIHYMDVHSPYEPPEEFRTFGTQINDLYDAQIPYFSREFGALFEFLRQEGRLEDTIVILTADHGEQFYDHGWHGHSMSLYREEVAVPLLVWSPSLEGAERIPVTVGLTDLPGALLETLSIEGLEFAADGGLGMLGAQSASAAPVFCELDTRYPPGQYIVSIADGERRLIVHNPSSKRAVRYELFDTTTDPGEKLNIAMSEAEAVAAMRQQIEEYLEEQAALRSRVAPTEVVVPLSEERARRLDAVGYLNK